MHLRNTGLAALILLSLPALAGAAQQPGGTAQQASPAPANGASTTAPQPNLDVSQLPVSLRRIQRELAQSTREREERDGVNLRYIIEVFGQAPAIELFTREDNLLNGPVPYGAPTHREMIYMMTPPEFRSPVMDFSGLFRWLSDKAK